MKNLMYTYNHVEPSVTPPFKKWIKRTRGKFSHITEPIGVFRFRYAVFVNRASELLIPLHDLTPETKKRIRSERSRSGNKSTTATTAKPAFGQVGRRKFAV